MDPQSAPSTSSHVATEMDSESIANEPPSLTNLNDDCLLKICNDLSLHDLSRLRRACKRAQPVADTLFVKKFKSQVEKDDLDVTMTKVDRGRILVSFGHLIEKLAINDSGLLQLINEYAKNIHSLKLNVANEIDMGLLTVYPNLFAEVERLNIDGSMVDDLTYATFFERCNKNLRELHLENQRLIPGACLARHFPQLVSLTMKCIEDINQLYLYQFFENNPQLKHIRLIDCSADFVNGDIIPKLAVHIPQLQTLSVSFRNEVNVTIYQLTHLVRMNITKLELRMNERAQNWSFLINLAVSPHLEHLHLSQIHLNLHAVSALRHFRCIRSLTLSSTIGIDWPQSISLAKNLKYLREINIIQCKSADVGNLSAFAMHSRQLERVRFIPFRGSSNLTGRHYNELVRLIRESRLADYVNGAPLPVRIYLESAELKYLKIDLRKHGRDNYEPNIVELLALTDEEYLQMAEFVDDDDMVPNGVIQTSIAFEYFVVSRGCCCCIVALCHSKATTIQSY